VQERSVVVSDDFETVRGRLRGAEFEASAQAGEETAIYENALAALDRIEAEVERLRADNLAMREVMKDEAVRLAIVVNERADLRAEVERLRAKVER
jgi:hypothetical protein